LHGTRSICLFLLNQDFQRRTEQMLEALHGSAHEAEEVLNSVFGGLNQAQACAQPHCISLSYMKAEVPVTITHQVPSL